MNTVVEWGCAWIVAVAVILILTGKLRPAYTWPPDPEEEIAAPPPPVDLDDMLVTADTVIAELPASIRDDFDWCPGAKTFGHQDVVSHRAEIHSFDTGLNRVIEHLICQDCHRRTSRRAPAAPLDVGLIFKE